MPGLRLQVDAKQVRVLVPMDVTSSESAAAVLTIRSMRLEMEPYGCLNYSHAAICKLAGRAAGSRASSERRALLEQMFMVPIKISLENVEVSAGLVEVEKERVPQSTPALNAMRNAVIRPLAPCVVEPMSLRVDVKLSMIRSDASLPLSFITIKIPALHLRFEVEALAELVGKTSAGTWRPQHPRAPISKEHPRAASSCTFPSRSLQLMERMALRAQTGRTPTGCRPGSRSTGPSRLSELSLAEELGRASMPDGRSSLSCPRHSGTGAGGGGATHARVPSRDWLDSSVHAALLHDDLASLSDAAAGDRGTSQDMARASPAGSAEQHNSDPSHPSSCLTDSPLHHLCASNGSTSRGTRGGGGNKWRTTCAHGLQLSSIQPR